MLTDEFKKDILQVVNDYLLIAYKVNGINEIDKVQSERKMPCLNIISIINLDGNNGEEMKIFIRHQLDILQDTGKIKTGRSKLRTLVSKILDDPKYSDYEFLKEQNFILLAENTELKRAATFKANRSRLFSAKTSPRYIEVSEEAKQTLIDNDIFEDGGEFVKNSWGG